MTTRANRANLQPKGTTHAPAKAAPKAPSKPASKPVKPTSKQLTKPTPPSATKAHQTAATRTPNATAQATGKAAGAGLKEAIDRRGAAAVLGSPAPTAPSPVTAASVTAKLEAAQPSGPLGLTPGDIREARRDPRNAIPPQAPRKAQRGLHIPSEADVQAQQELRAAMTSVPATGPYSLDAAQMAAAQVAAAHTATLIAVKRMSTTERHYAKRRMEDVISRKKLALKQERDASDKYQERRRIFAEEIAKGHFTINQAALVKATYDTDLRDVVMLHNYPAGLEAYTRSQYAAIDARQATMEREGARIIDEIMLGSPADAIVQIQRFESTKF